MSSHTNADDAQSLVNENCSQVNSLLPMPKLRMHSLVSFATQFPPVERSILNSHNAVAEIAYSNRDHGAARYSPFHQHMALHTKWFRKSFAAQGEGIAYAFPIFRAVGLNFWTSGCLLDKNMRQSRGSEILLVCAERNPPSPSDGRKEIA